MVVELEEDGVKAVGECTPYPRYGESEASVIAQIMSILPQLENRLTREELQTLLPAGAARNAVDCALWDLEARRQGMTLGQYVGVTLPATVTTAQTVVIGTPEQMAASASALWETGARLLKVKLDDHLISERLVAIRAAAPEATLIVDANEAGKVKVLLPVASFWPILAWQCSNSLFRQAMMPRWITLSILCPSVPMKVATRNGISPRWRAL